MPIERSPDKRTPDKNKEEIEVAKEKNKSEEEEDEVNPDTDQGKETQDPADALPAKEEIQKEQSMLNFVVVYGDLRKEMGELPGGSGLLAACGFLSDPRGSGSKRDSGPGKNDRIVELSFEKQKKPRRHDLTGAIREGLLSCSIRLGGGKDEDFIAEWTKGKKEREEQERRKQDQSRLGQKEEENVHAIRQKEEEPSPRGTVLGEVKIQREVGIIQCQNCLNKKGQQFNADHAEFRKQSQQDAERRRSEAEECREEEDKGARRERLKKEEKRGRGQRRQEEERRQSRGKEGKEQRTERAKEQGSEPRMR